MKYLYLIYDLNNHINNIFKLVTDDYYVIIMKNDLKKYMNCFKNICQYYENLIQHYNYKFLLLCLY